MISYEWRGAVRNVELAGHSLGWVILDTLVAAAARRRGIGTRMVEIAAERARAERCEWLHVDFEEQLRSFYVDGCGFRPTRAGLIAL